MLYFKYACLHDFGFSKMFVLKIKNLARDGDQNMPFTVEPRIIFEPKTLKIISIKSNFIPEEKYWKEPSKRNDWVSPDGPETSGVKFAGDGDALVYWLPGRYGYVDKKEGQSWEEFFRHFSFYPISDLMQKLYDLILIGL